MPDEEILVARYELYVVHAVQDEVAHGRQAEGALDVLLYDACLAKAVQVAGDLWFVRVHELGDLCEARGPLCDHVQYLEARGVRELEKQFSCLHDDNP